jgi:hypothetical protein
VTVVMSAVQLAFEITWDPGLRGVLAVLTGVVVLCGSIYLLLGTNLGSRLGFLVAVAGLAGWMVIMGLVWWVYGIGYVGDAPSWKVREVVTSQDQGDLSASALRDAHDLSDWTELPADDPTRGEAQATAGAALTGENSPVAMFDSESDFVVLDAYRRGGRPDNFFANWVPAPHPPHYSIVQVQRVVEVEVEFGEAPPPPEADESAPVVSVVMVRDLGDERLPPALLTIASLIIFGITCSSLHRRDKAVAEARARADATV